jgi:threonine dehydrogenase-like Zn-dependent dehydrogenase
MQVLTEREAVRIAPVQTMQAFTFHGIGQARIAEKAIPIPAPDEAVVRTTAALICTLDVHTVRGAIKIPIGRTLGHEAVGVGRLVSAILVQPGQLPGDTRRAVSSPSLTRPCAREVVAWASSIRAYLTAASQPKRAGAVSELAAVDIAAA